MTQKEQVQRGNKNLRHELSKGAFDTRINLGDLEVQEVLDPNTFYYHPTSYTEGSRLVFHPPRFTPDGQLDFSSTTTKLEIQHKKKGEKPAEDVQPSEGKRSLKDILNQGFAIHTLFELFEDDVFLEALGYDPEDVRRNQDRLREIIQTRLIPTVVGRMRKKPDKINVVDFFNRLIESGEIEGKIVRPAFIYQQTLGCDPNSVAISKEQYFSYRVEWPKHAYKIGNRPKKHMMYVDGRVDQVRKTPQGYMTVEIKQSIPNGPNEFHMYQSLLNKVGDEINAQTPDGQEERKTINATRYKPKIKYDMWLQLLRDADSLLYDADTGRGYRLHILDRKKAFATTRDIAFFTGILQESMRLKSQEAKKQKPEQTSFLKQKAAEVIEPETIVITTGPNLPNDPDFSLARKRADIARKNGNLETLVKFYTPIEYTPAECLSKVKVLLQDLKGVCRWEEYNFAEERQKNAQVADEQQKESYKRKRRTWRLDQTTSPSTLVDVHEAKEAQSIVLANRGIEDFKNWSLNSEVDPFTQDVGELGFDSSAMKNAVTQITDAVRNGNKVVYVPTNTLEGVLSAYIVHKLNEVVRGNFQIYFPDPEKDGDGLTPLLTKKLISEGNSLIVSIGSGLRSGKAATIAAEGGATIIVADNDQIKTELPANVTAFNPTDLEKTEISFFLARDVAHSMGQELPDVTDILGLSALSGTTPLRGSNLRIASRGLTALEQTENPFLKNLVESLSKSQRHFLRVNERSIPRYFVPFLNAAIKFGSAQRLFHLLKSEEGEFSPQAFQSNFVSMEMMEERSRELANTQYLSALRKIQNQGQLKSGLVFVADPSFDEDVNAAVADRLSNKLQQPVIVGTTRKHKLIAAGRSVDGFNLLEAIQSRPEALLSVQGHEKTVSFRLFSDEDGQTLSDFQSSLHEYAGKHLIPENLTPNILFDAQIPLRFAPQLIDTISKLGPFGEGNKEPTFISRGARVTEIKERRKYIELALSQRGMPHILAFGGEGMKKRLDELALNRYIDILFSLGEYVDGRTNTKAVGLRIKDFQPVAAT